MTATHLIQRAQTPLEKWSDLKFGMFIHFGVYSVPVGKWKGKNVPGLGIFLLITSETACEVVLGGALSAPLSARLLGETGREIAFEYADGILRFDLSGLGDGVLAGGSVIEVVFAEFPRFDVLLVHTPDFLLLLPADPGSYDVWLQSVSRKYTTYGWVDIACAPRRLGIPARAHWSMRRPSPRGVRVTLSRKRLPHRHPADGPAGNAHSAAAGHQHQSTLPRGAGRIGRDANENPARQICLNS